jgi:hypothetical protein
MMLLQVRGIRVRVTRAASFGAAWREVGIGRHANLRRHGCGA